MGEITVPYKPRNWAKKLHESYKRFFSLVIHRRGGKTTGIINHMQRCALDDARERARMKFLMSTISDNLLEKLLLNRFYGIVYPTYKQAKLVAWDMLKFYAKNIPHKANEVDLRIIYPNQAKIQLFGADNPDSLRGAPFWGLGFDEYSQQPANIFSEVLSKSLADHLGFAIFAGTIKGKNQLFRTNEVAKANPEEWDYIWQDIDQTLTTENDETLLLLRRALEDDKRLVEQGMMTQEEFDQEWYLSTEAAIKGAYYLSQISLARKRGRIGIVPYDQALKVHTIWDLGVGQAMGIGFFQRMGIQTRMIDYWEGDNKEGIPTAIKEIRRKPYIYGKHFAPHDINATDASTEKTRKQTAKELGVEFEEVPKLSVDEGIGKAKLMWNHLWVDEKNCQVWIDYVSQYHQEWDDKRGMFIESPYHDFTSHAADILRYASIIEDQMGNEEEKGYKQPPHQAESEYEGGENIDEWGNRIITEEELGKM